ncbi:MAG: ACT domain-containing protein [Acidimicrobiales bacterium]
MPRYAIEISLQDQPGALGAVASLIGKFGGDVVDVDVLEHGRGRARDEITVELAGPEIADQLGKELSSLPGVEVDHLAPLGEYGHHLLVDALEVAAAMVAETSPPGLLDALVTGVVAAFSASWAVVVSEGRDRPIAAAGGVPPASVTRTAGGPLRFAGSDDCLALPIGEQGMVLVVGREGWAFRNRERRELTTLTHVAATRYEQLAR